MLFSPWAAAALAGLIGLLIGSFLNVVIHRSPRMMYRAWLQDALENLREADAPLAQSLWKTVFGRGSTPPADLTTAAHKAYEQVQALPPLTLARPRSRCNDCERPIRWWENLPLLSYLALRGRCAGCGQPYGLRYPAVELLTGLLFAYCGWRWGLSATGALWAAFCALLVALAFIDWDTTLLPDDLVLPLLWLGLLASAAGLVELRLNDAVWGAIAGYLSLWTVGGLFQLVTGKQGMGHGDFKLLAALGAWLGWQALIPVVLLSSVIGAGGGIALKLGGGLRAGGYFPFGPFLAGAGLLVMMLGPHLANAILPR
ncbi:MAG: Type 4 prepilin-like proteins leader peptide-processing enzyme [Paracidovorax wautersii]|uniref:Prepilin leader peptidase/N-methyltransferase n=1 Tax=Paracidovorax wautersii TaxID=1177982 RepID=A0A7V8FQD3_9BURK|nr:MAG: Type 4 prepilin-like proteins leader peptide-processing enzyme [Paracidovorax wautersii]